MYLGDMCKKYAANLFSGYSKLKSGRVRSVVHAVHVTQCRHAAPRFDAFDNICLRTELIANRSESLELLSTPQQ